MAFFTKTEARNAAAVARGYHTSASILNESMKRHGPHEKFDIFLSHSLEDADLVLGVMTLLQKQGLSVYVDWVVDKHLSRESVNKETAAVLRQRMQNSSSLMYISTGNSSNSKWMPWELGYFDGHKPNRVAILPLLDSESQSFEGQEYLGLYPVVSKQLPTQGTNLYVEDRGTKWSHLRSFARGIPAWESYR